MDSLSLDVKLDFSGGWLLYSNAVRLKIVEGLPTFMGVVMAGYRKGSKWSDLNELRCLCALKQLEELDFPRGMHTVLSNRIADESGLPLASIKAKIGNYKSVAGVTRHSNASQNTISIYNNYGHLSSFKIQELLSSGDYS